MVTQQPYERKKFCDCFHFIWLWLFISVMKRCAELCALQLYQTSLTSFLNLFVNIQIDYANFKKFHEYIILLLEYFLAYQCVNYVTSIIFQFFLDSLVGSLPTLNGKSCAISFLFFTFLELFWDGLAKFVFEFFFYCSFRCV